jgi:hypothetical protein
LGAAHGEARQRRLALEQRLDRRGKRAHSEAKKTAATMIARIV